MLSRVAATAHATGTPSTLAPRLRSDARRSSGNIPEMGAELSGGERQTTNICPGQGPIMVDVRAQNPSRARGVRYVTGLDYRRLLSSIRLGSA
jgi:hypothetical protein